MSERRTFTCAGRAEATGWLGKRTLGFVEGSGTLTATAARWETGQTARCEFVLQTASGKGALLAQAKRFLGQPQSFEVVLEPAYSGDADARLPMFGPVHYWIKADPAYALFEGNAVATSLLLGKVEGAGVARQESAEQVPDEPAPEPAPIPGPRPPAPVVRTGAPSYWPVNFWHALPKDEVRRGLDALAEAGLWGLNLELLGWSDSSVYEDPGRIEEPIEFLVAEARQRELSSLISMGNDNLGLIKHGNKDPRGLKDFSGQLSRALAIVKALGPARLAVQPVAETRTQAGRGFESQCLAELKGFFLVYNGHGGRPEKALKGFHAFAWHPTKAGVMPPQNAWYVTDTSGILAWLSQGGDFEGGAPFDSARVADTVARCYGWGNPCHLYGFRHRAIDFEAIRSAGRAWAVARNSA
jgi:hypothetical protein